jgi:CubicO group peptidase (beta-lactamase class C family)
VGSVKKQHTYGIGSTTKLLSSVLIFHHIEKGDIALDDAITQYITNTHFNTIENIEQVTIRSLLNHTTCTITI